jgi:hypothetical protein
MLGDLLASRLYSAFWFWGTAVSLDISLSFVIDLAVWRTGRNLNHVGRPEFVETVAYR